MFKSFHRPLFTLVLQSFQHRSVYSFARSVVGRKGVNFVEAREKQNLMSQPLIVFKSVEHINNFINCKEELTTKDLTLIVQNLTQLNKGKILEYDQQKILLDKLLLQTQLNPVILNDSEFITQLCLLIFGYRTHAYNEEKVVKLNKVILAHYIDSNHVYSSNLVLNILKIYDDEVIQPSKLIVRWYQNVLQLIKGGFKFELKFKDLQNIYKVFYLSNSLGLQLDCQKQLVDILHLEIPRFQHQLQPNDILAIVRNGMFKTQVFNMELVSTLVRQGSRLIDQMDIRDIIELNEFFVRLGVANSVWLNALSKRISNGIDEVLRQEENTEQLEDQKEIMPQEKDNMGPECQLLELMNSFKNINPTDQNINILIPFFKRIEGYLLSYLHLFSIDQQLCFIHTHSLLLEFMYADRTARGNELGVRYKKKIGKLNNNYYEIVLPYLKEMNFNQTLQFLECATVLGVSKRQLCQQIFQIGLAGIKRFDPAQLHLSSQALLGYYKLIKMFITSEQQLILIEQSFKDIKVDTLDLQTNWGYLNFDRKQIQNTLQLV